MTNENYEKDYPLRPISDFICYEGEDIGRDGNFYIPSYQRGFRWEAKEIEYLLNDIREFLEKNGSKASRPFYCLQPIVVKKKNWCDIKTKEKIEGWEVIDGQQRLTTLKLILKELQPNSDYSNSKLYSITYETRSELNIDEIDAHADINSFYIKQAQEEVRLWIETFKRSQKNYTSDLSDLRKALFGGGKGRSVKVIWYEDQSDEKLDSIKTFNNLNKGRISLTSSELIKACFMLHYKDMPNMQTEIASEWYRMEVALQNKYFWSFLANKEYNPSTHIDIIFDLLSERPADEDRDYSYRKFQKMFEGKARVGQYNADTIWDGVKQVFGTFQYWFEETTLYHYIGFLIYIGMPLKKIYDDIHLLRKDAMREILRAEIKNELNINEERLRALRYGDKNTRSVLLLFCIATMIEMGSLRFDFAAFKEEALFDVEHISSKTTNNLQKTEDRLKWITYLDDLSSQVGESKKTEWEKIMEDASKMREKMQMQVQIGRDDFNNLFTSVVEIVDSRDISDDDKDLISNLTLLDSHTNRSYGNALFPTKRNTIIANERSGRFVPLTTRNVFLKYYSTGDKQQGQWSYIWNKEDATAYLNKIVETLKPYLK